MDRKSTTSRQLRSSILKQGGVITAPMTKKLIHPASLKDTIRKTKGMKLIEYKYSIHIEEEVFTCSLSELAHRYREIDRSTFSRWRKYFRKYLLKDSD